MVYVQVQRETVHAMSFMNFVNVADFCFISFSLTPSVRLFPFHYYFYRQISRMVTNNSEIKTILALFAYSVRERVSLYSFVRMHMYVRSDSHCALNLYWQANKWTRRRYHIVSLVSLRQLHSLLNYVLLADSFECKSTNYEMLLEMNFYLGRTLALFFVPFASIPFLRRNKCWLKITGLRVIKGATNATDLVANCMHRATVYCAHEQSLYNISWPPYNFNEERSAIRCVSLNPSNNNRTLFHRSFL